MDLRGIANSVSSTINSNEIVRVRHSTGFTIGAGRKQVPTYASPVEGSANVQALDGNDLKQLEGLNIQGTVKAIYFRGKLGDASRPDGTGGDLVLRGTNFEETWLVVKVIEGWLTWTKAAIVLQVPA